MRKMMALMFILFSSSMVFAFGGLPVSSYQIQSGSFHGLGPSPDYNFEGIARFLDCSGSLVIFKGMPLTAKALVMSNGHCIYKPDGNYLAPGEVWVNRKATITIELFNKEKSIFEVRTSRLIYATMTDTDLSFYELTQSYEEIQRAAQIHPFLLDDQHPKAGQAVDIISGDTGLGYSCQIESFIFKLKEDEWTFKDSLRYTSGTSGGTSGSPVIARNERRIVGVNNTSNREGQSCTLNNPCEVTSKGEITAQQGVSYGQQTYQVYTCLAPDFSLDLNRPGCLLPH